jgi:hypothetical protein
MKVAPSPYLAEIERIPNRRKPEAPLFRYSIRHEKTDELLFDGVASDMREAMDSVNAWIDYLMGAAAA